MYRQIVRFYVFLLTLLEISLNSKLTAQGKSHGVLHDALISEGITFQEWGKDGGAAAGEAGAAGGALSVSPPRLSFGPAALGAAHALTVTVTNTANTTLHLASVAGTTPDFHASFFDSKTLPPQGNTSFSVVFVGRREGPVAAHLYIHTSLGVHKYEVSAVGTVSEWGVWPLVGLRVPRDAALTPTLTLTNPTDSTVQVVSVYSSAGWLGLELPDGGAWAPRALWALPPRAARPLVRLRVAPPSPPAAAPHAQPRVAYIRIKTDLAGHPPLVVCVEARAVAAGVHADPVQLRAGLRGSRDPPHTFEVSLGNSASTGVALEPAVWGARCSGLDAPPPQPPPPPPSAARANGASNGGAGGDAARVRLLTTHLEPNSQLQRAATVTLDWSAMWSGAAGASGGGGGALCSGYVQLGDAALPYSATLLPGTVHVDPLHFVTGGGGGGGGWAEPRALVVRNEFSVPVHFTHARLDPDIHKYFHTEPVAAQTVAGGAARTLTSLRLRSAEPELALHAHIHLHTNVTVYSVPVLVYSGKLIFEWSWPESYSGSLTLGAVATGRELRVALRLRNPAPAPLCVSALSATLPHATLTLAERHTEGVCVEALGSVRGALTLRAPAREGPVRGAVHVSTQHARAEHAVTLHAVHGDVRAHHVHLDHCAPWVECAAPLLVDSSMAATMRLLRVRTDQPALRHVGGANWEVGHGESALGELHYRHELLPTATLYTGLDLDTAEGEQWVRRSGAALPPLLAADAALLRARIALLADLPDTVSNLSLTLTTTHVVQVEVPVSARLRWPRLGRLQGGEGEVLAPVGGAATLTVAVHNPSSRRLLLQPLLGDHHALPVLAGGTESAAPCSTPPCVTSLGAFNVTSWREAEGAAALWARDDVSGTVLTLDPLATVHVLLTFTPQHAGAHHAYLYLRNNLTIVEAVPLAGRGARPSFELAGRVPGSPHPLLFEVSECGAAPTRVAVSLRNTGSVPVAVTSLLVSGQPCAAHGFSVQPCVPLTLAPGESRRLHLAFSPDWTLARVRRALTLLTETGRAEFVLQAAVPARLLPACGAAVGRAPGEGALRGAGAVLALLLAALGLALAAMDSEAILKRALAAMQRDRPPTEPGAPLDLRALNHVPPCVPPPPPPPPPPRRRRKQRQQLAFDDKKDEFAEWKLSVCSVGGAGEEGRRALAEDESSRSSAEETEPPDSPPDPAPERDESLGTDSSNSEERESSPAEPTQPPRHEEAKRAVRARRELATPTRRHEERPRAADRHDDVASRGLLRTNNGAKFHKKDKTVKRKSLPPLAPPPPPPPPLGATPTSNVRKGATFSEVVARADSLYSNGSNVPVTTACDPAARPLAPIGSDLRKRSSPDALTSQFGRAADHSLFYFNGECDPSPRPWEPPAQAQWEHAAAPPPPAAPPHYAQQDRVGHNYTEDKSGLSEFSGGLGTSLWSAGDSWSGGGWGGGYGLRPPPGFPRAPPAPPRAAPPVRAFDPFHALAAIWASDRPAWAEPPDQHDDQRR